MPHKNTVLHNLIVPPTPTPTPTFHSLPFCDLAVSVSRTITMNSSESYSNKDDLALATPPDPVWAIGDYPYHPYPSVPQSTHLDLVSDPGYPSTTGSYVPDFNAAGDAAFSLTPTTKMEAFVNLPTQLDFTNQVSNQCVGTSTLTYRAVPQNVLDPWSMPAPCMFLSRICYDPSYSPMWIQSFLRRESRGRPAAAGWRPLLPVDGGHSACRLLGGRNT
jgi:hypothetical protein